MRLTVIRADRPEERRPWQIQTLERAATARGLACEVRDLNPAISPAAAAAELGEVVIYRSTALSPSHRLAITEAALKRGVVWLNRARLLHPRLSYKSYQQQLVAERTSVATIPTWHFKFGRDLRQAQVSGEVSLPLIRKPEIGAQGQGVELISSVAQLPAGATEISSDIWQPYIANTGDFRVIVVGGRVLGVMRRVRAAGAVTNNVAQGGQALAVTDPLVVAELTHIAQALIEVIPLDLVGFDIIFDETTRHYRFLELNTVPQWEAFERVTGVDVGAAIVAQAITLVQRRSSAVGPLVYQHYQRRLPVLPPRMQWHFASRWWLWTGSPSARRYLDSQRGAYLGETSAAVQSHIVERWGEAWPSGRRPKFWSVRQEAFARHPQVAAAERLLFFQLFAQTIYGQDVRPDIEELVSFDELQQVRASILASPADIVGLGSYAANYVCLLEQLWPEAAVSSVPVGFWFDFLTAAERHVSTIERQLVLYVLTHVVLCGSRYYQQRVFDQQATYHEMLAWAERVIADHWIAISLDIKVEFLVCCQLVGYTSRLRDQVLTEAQASFSPLGNFVVNTHNDHGAGAVHTDSVAEHTNILLLMALTPFQGVAATPVVSDRKLAPDFSSGSVAWA